MTLRALLALVVVTSAAAQEKGTYTLHLLAHAVGEESYEVTPAAAGRLTLKSAYALSDRGMKRSTQTTLEMTSDLTAKSYETTGRPGAAIPPSVQDFRMRAWRSHGAPSEFAMLPETPPKLARISLAGHDSVIVDGKKVSLDRYTLEGLAFGRELVWMDGQGRMAALMTFAGGLPFEAVRKEYEGAFPTLTKLGVAAELRILETLQRTVPATADGAFAIVGATLIDGTDSAPVPDSVVIVRAGRIAALGPRLKVEIPRGTTLIDGTGQSLLPGLWEMHTHYSGVEFGPALLAAGITTARDCGGEFDFLLAIRDAIEKRSALGPRLLLAGLVDGAGDDAFGAVTADTPDEARAVVARYKQAGFQQIKLYTILKPEIVTVLAAEAHRQGMTVTGHIPRELTLVSAVEAGMDQINHLNTAQVGKAVEFLREHRTVMDPTISWSEMAGRGKDVDVLSFEPGVAKAPEPVAFKFQHIGGVTEASKVRERMAENFRVIRALREAGVPIVAGSDTGLIGYGLHREIELYVEAGLTPLQAIQSATIVAARAMGMQTELGTVEAGKRADLILVRGDPLQDIRALRNVTTVVSKGRAYDTAKLWQSAGFRP